MTTVPATLPRVRSIGLPRAETLKLRKRRGLVVTVTLLAIAPQVIAYGILLILHAANPDHHGPAGGIDNLGHGMSILILLGCVAAVVVGSSTGADDVNSGVFRELVVTGRSRVALFFARIPGGLLFLLPFAAVAFALSAFVSGLANGYLPAPSTTLLIESGIWVLANVSFYFVLGLGLASLTGSRAYTIGILIAWRTIVSHIIMAIGALGVGRQAVPEVGLDRLAPHAVRSLVTDGPTIGVSVAAAVAVPLLWLAVAIAIGAWRTATRDA
jgi:ABC-2 family transporter